MKCLRCAVPHRISAVAYNLNGAINRTDDLLAHPSPHPPSSPPSTRHSRNMAIVILLLFYTFICAILSMTEAADLSSSLPASATDYAVTYYGPSSINEGDNLTISCQMSRFQAPQWTHNDRPLEVGTSSEEDEAGQGGPRISTDLTSESLQTSRLERLVITGVRLKDGGYYRCNSFSRRAHQVHVIPMTSRHSVDSSTNGEVILYQQLENEHERIEIDCGLDIANPKSPVYWSKDGNFIEKDERRYPDGSTLVIENATSEKDAGVYLCRTDNMEAEGGARFGQYIHLRAPIRVKPFSLPTVYKVQNESLEVICRYSGYPHGRITWIVGNRQLSENKLRYEGIELRQSEESNDTLHIDHLKMEHSTAFTCRVDNTLTSGEETFLLKVRENEVYINGPHVLSEKRELRIQCNISEHTNSDRSGVRWYKDNRDITEIDELQDRLQLETISSRQWLLVLNHAEISDVGNYTCVHNKVNATTRVRSRPILFPFEEFQTTNYKSANIVDGERFSLRCALAPGYERDARIEWYIYHETEVDSSSGAEYPPATHLLTPINDTHERIRIETNESDSSVSVLTIAAVKPQDRFFYVCKAHNDVISYNNTILLRVKDRLAALWPFIGIVCEVLILVIVIFVYEKRRVKPDFDEPNQNRNDEGNWSPPDRASRSQTEVRQRK